YAATPPRQRTTPQEDGQEEGGKGPQRTRAGGPRPACYLRRGWSSRLDGHEGRRALRPAACSCSTTHFGAHQPWFGASADSSTADGRDREASGPEAGAQEEAEQGAREAPKADPGQSYGQG